MPRVVPTGQWSRGTAAAGGKHTVIGPISATAAHRPTRVLRQLYLWYSRAMSESATRRGTDTRERLLDVAEAAVLEKGFAATSVEEMIAAVGITKSGFFYHFRDKSELAKALLQRYIEREDVLLADLFARADELNEDPLHGMLVALRMLAELMADLPVGHPGCLVASICYQEQLFNPDVRELNRTGVLRWRALFLERFERIAAQYPPRIKIDLEALADMFAALADGGIIVSKVVQDKDVLPRQILLYRDFVRAVFAGT
jgi:TetR/AcrR family transcriptional regulator, transcriptional repressor for nem operon